MACLLRGSGELRFQRGELCQVSVREQDGTEKTRRLTFPFSFRIRRAGAAGQAREISDLFVYFYKAEEGWAGETSECIER